jgi:hypothetical protein
VSGSGFHSAMSSLISFSVSDVSSCQLATHHTAVITRHQTRQKNTPELSFLPLDISRAKVVCHPASLSFLSLCLSLFFSNSLSLSYLLARVGGLADEDEPDDEHD